MIGKRTWMWTFAAGSLLACGLVWADDGPEAPPAEALSRADSADDLHDALDLLQQGQFEEAEQAARELLDHDEQTDEAWLVLASSLQQRRLYDAASEAYRRYLEQSPENKLGPYVREQIRRCRKPRLQRLAAASAPSEALSDDQLDQLAVVDDKVHTETSEQLVVRARNAQLARLIVTEAQKALDRVCDEVLAGQTFRKSVDVYVWTDRKEYLANACDAPEWSGGSFSLEKKNGRVVSRRIDLTQRDERGEFDVTSIDRILPHELCHLVINELFADRDCPLMLNEGLAMLAEYGVDNSRVMLAGTALSGKGKIPLADLMTIQWHEMDEPGVFYAESFSFAEFLFSRLSDQQYRQFLEHVRNGETIVTALQRCLAIPADPQFTRKLTVAWEDYAVAQTQYLRALNIQLSSMNKRLD